MANLTIAKLALAKLQPRLLVMQVMLVMQIPAFKALTACTATLSLSRSDFCSYCGILESGSFEWSSVLERDYLFVRWTCFSGQPLPGGAVAVIQL
jgi:hypothetical protein